MSNTVTPTPNQKNFFKGLRSEVLQFLDENQLSQIDQRGMIKKAIICYSLWIVFYAAVYLSVGYLFAWHALWLVVPMAFALLCIVLAVMHDGSHGTFANSKVLNQLAAFSIGFAGGSSMIWYKLHVRAHHDDTNVIGHDQDFESGGLLRLHTAQIRKKAFRYQHFYAWFLYLGHACRWILFDDVHDYFTNRWGFDRKERRQLMTELVIVKSWHLLCFIIVPALVVGWQVALVVYLAHWMLLSLAMILIFAMAHLSEVQRFPAAKGEYPDYALHQLATTADFAAKNRALSWVIGGLNFQIEHHIFPKISHTRYPAIQKVVKAYCEKHGVEFLEFPTFFSVLRAHFRHLRALGAPG